ncbi:MAG: serine/threonine-protein kinase, partial [Planctomycetota bacterium]
YYAHQEKILHRDIKLENILVTPAQVVKILDFGLAKDLASEESLKLTQSGTFFGTGHYMAPEQARGEIKNITPRTDLYAVGICLYRLLTGYYPYEGSTIQKLVAQIEKGSAKLPRVWNPKIHKDLEAIVMKSIAYDPEMRYVSARFFVRDLKNFLAGHPVEASLLKTGISRWKTWSKKHQYPLRWTAFFLVIFLLSILGVLWNQDREKRKIWEAQYALAKEKYDQSHSKEVTEKTKTLWDGLIFINKLLNLGSQKKAEELKWDIGIDLLKITEERQSYLWANYLIEELEHLEKIPAKKRIALRQEQEKNRKKKIVYYEKRLHYWEKKLKSGNCSKSEKDDVVYEIIKMDEDVIFQKVKQILETGNQYMLTLKN